MSGLNAIRSLTSLRFFAAFMVLGSHLRQQISYTSPVPFIEFIWNQVFSEGYIGVTFFFILSGFILTYNYDSLFKFNKISNKKFLFLRFARIYPTHILLCLLVLCTIPFSSQAIVPAIANAFLFQSYVPSAEFYFSVNAVSWSISAELFFYLLFPLFVLMSKEKILKIVLMFLGAILFLIWVSTHYNFLISGHWLFYIFPGTRLLDFLIGIWLAKIFLSSKDSISTKPTWFFQFAEPVSLLMLAYFIYFALTHSVHQVYRFDVFYIIPMSLIIFIFAQERGFVSKLLTKRTFVFLGEISFALYMLHQQFFSLFIRTFPLDVWGGLGISNKLVLTIALLSSTLIMAAISFMYFENPMNHYLRHRMRRKEDSSRVLVGEGIKEMRMDGDVGR